MSLINGYNEMIFKECSEHHAEVYSYKYSGLCPRCRAELKKNQFGNYTCDKCFNDYINGWFWLEPMRKKPTSLQEHILLLEK